MNIIAEIETFLISRADWVREEEIVAHFGLDDDRLLRATGKRPGPLSRCAIFSGKGIKHLSCATPREIGNCRRRITRELISRVRRLRWLKEGISNLHQGRWESHTGQGVLL